MNNDNIHEHSVDKSFSMFVWTICPCRYIRATSHICAVIMNITNIHFDGRVDTQVNKEFREVFILQPVL